MKLLNKRLVAAKPIGFLLLLSSTLLASNCCQGQSLSDLQLDLADVGEASNDDSSPDHAASYVDLDVLEKRVDQNETKIEQLDQRLNSIEARPESVGKKVQAATSGWCNNPTSCMLTELRTVEMGQLPLSVPLAAPVHVSWPASSVTVFGSHNGCPSCNTTLQSTEIIPLPSSLPMATFVEATPWGVATDSISQPTLERSTERTFTTNRPVVTRGSLIGRLARGRSIQRSRTFNSQPQPLSSSCRIVNGVRSCN